MHKPSQPWQQYYEAFAQQAARIPGDAFDRAALLYDAAHNAYESATNEWTAAGWDEERALVIGRMFGSVVKQWVDTGEANVEALKEELRARYREWNAHD